MMKINDLLKMQSLLGPERRTEGNSTSPSMLLPCALTRGCPETQSHLHHPWGNKTLPNKERTNAWQLM